MKNTILRLLVLVLFTALHACSFGDGGEGSLTFTARFPDKVVFKSPGGAYKSSAVDLPVEITTIRVTAKHESGTVVLREFDATLRSGELLNIATGVYEVTLEGLVGSTVILRGRKTGVVVETAKVRDAGEFQMGPVDPVAELAAAPNVITNQTAITLSGAKEMFTGIKVNDQIFVELNDLTAFEFIYLLAEGENNLTISAFNAEGVAGTPIGLKILLDTKAPKVVSFASAAGNLLNSSTVALAINVEGASEMMISADSRFRGASWVPYSATASFSMPANANTIYGQFRDKAGNVSALASVAVVVDMTPPSAGMVELAGKATAVASLSLSLAINATGATEMVISELPGFAGAQRQPYAGSASFELSAGDGVRIIYVRFFDAAGNFMDAQTSFVVDTQAPTNPMIEIAGIPVTVNITTLSLNLSATGADFMQISEDPAFPLGDWISYSTVGEITLALTGDGLKTVYVQFSDTVGNVSSAAQTSVFLDTTPPKSPTVGIVGSPTAVSTSSITVTLSATDAVDFQVSEDPAFGGATWAPMSASTPFILSGGDASKTVYARYRDAVGNISPNVFVSVDLDQTPPTLTSVDLANDAVDGWINAAEFTNPIQLASFIASGYDTIGFALVANATVCDNALLYGVMPKSNSGDFGADGLYKICARLADTVGWVVYGASAPFELDTLAPSVFVGGDLTLNVSNLFSSVATGAVTYAWTQQSGPGTLNFDAPALFQTNVFADLDGVYTIRLTVTDAAGNPAVDELSLTWDTTPPQSPTVGIAGSPVAVSDPAITVTLSATDAVDFQVSEDPAFGGATWVPMSASIPFTLSGGDASKTVYAKYRDAVGNETSGVSVSVDLDTTAPILTFVTTANDAVDGWISSPERANLNALALHTGTGYLTVGFKLVSFATTCDGSLTYDPVSPNSDSPDFGSDGSYKVCVELADLVGWKVYGASAVIKLDTIAPQVFAGGDVLVNLQTNISAVVTGATLQSWSQVAGPGAIAFGDSTTVSTTASASLSGVYTLRISVSDAAGNPAFDELQFTWDTDAPSAPASLALSANPASGPVTLTWVGSTDVLSGIADYVVNESPDSGSSWFPLGSTTDTSFLLTPSEGNFYYKVVARDGVYNTSAESAWSSALSMDFSAPTVLTFVVQGSPTAVNTAFVTLDLSATESGEMQLSEDPAFGGASWIAFDAAPGFTLSGGDGAKTIYVRIRDAAGNISSPASTNVDLDTSVPTVTIDSPVNASVFNLVGSASGTASDPGVGVATVEIQIQDTNTGMFYDGSVFTFSPVWVAASYAVGSWSYSLSFLSDSNYEISARAVDAAGNIGYMSPVNFTLDSSPPSVPGTPTFSANPASTSVTISWTASSDSLSGLQDYVLEESTDGFIFFTVDFTVSDTYIHTPANGMYYYRVAARDLAGNSSGFSPDSTPLQIDTDAPSPGMVNDGLSIDAVFQTSLTAIDANWSSFFDAGTGIDFYEWAIGTAPGDEDIQAFTNVGLVSSASATGLTLTDGFSYFVAVRATDFAGNRVVLVSDGVTVDATGPFSGIVEDGFGLDEDIMGSGTFGANWSGFSDAESLIVDYQWGIGTIPGDDSILAFVSVGLGTTGSEIAPSFINGTTYYVTVIATNGAGATVSATSDGFVYDTLPPTAPGTPTFSTNPVSDSVTVSWTASSDAETGVMDYDLLVSLDGGITYSWVATTGDTIYLYTPGVEQFYYFRVVARDLGLNMSADSATSAGLEYDVTPPSAGFINDSSGIDLDLDIFAGAISANWSGFSDSGSGIVKYVWWAGTATGASDTVAPTNMGLAVSATTAVSLVVGTTYYNTVRAYDAAGNAIEISSDGFVVPPFIASLSTASTGIGGPVTLNGQNFGGVQGLSTVTVGGILAPVTLWSSTSIDIDIPAGLTSGFHAVVVNVEGIDSNNDQAVEILLPTELFFTSAPLILTAGQCSTGTVDVITRDSFSDQRGVSSPTMVNLTATNLTFWSDISCTASINSYNLAAGQSSFSFYVKSNFAANEPVNITADGLTGTNQNQLVNPGAVAMWAWVTPMPIILSNQCAPFTVQTQDSYGNASNVGVNTSITLSDGGFGGTFYQTGACSAALSLPNVAGGTNSFSFYYQAVAPGSPVLQVSGDIFAIATHNLTVNVSPPSIASLTPSTGPIGANVNISGADFGATQSVSTVFVGAQSATVSSWASSSIDITIPGGLTDGVHNVIVTVGGQPSNSYAFAVSTPPTPSISSISPGSAAPNALITVSGADFGATSAGAAVYFGGVSTVNVTNWTSSSFDVLVPGLAPPGNIDVVVKTSAGKSSPYPFEHMRPWIDTRFPASGTVGTTVSLSGRYFGATQNLVYVNGSSATIQGWSDTTVQITIPAGIPKGPVNIVLQNLNGDSSNAMPFGQRGQDVWISTGDGPAARGSHVAVWTGMEMLIWGGYDGAVRLDSGARYNPATDTWAPMSKGANAPSPRLYMSAVWTGQSMIVWGGDTASGVTNTGGRYDPQTDTWLTVSTGANSPAARANHTAIWAGDKMIVWGGCTACFSTVTDGGAMYDPISDTWTAMVSTPNRPTPRFDHSAVWTGSRMIVWGGVDGTYTPQDAGGRYNPQNDTWELVDTVLAPVLRRAHIAVWTGTEMVVWGGYNDFLNTVLDTGGRYNPLTNSWTATALAPGARTKHKAVWTGSEVLIFGGNDLASTVFLNELLAYVPGTDSWLGRPAAPITERSGQSMVWTGTKALVWGGGGLNNEVFNDGAVFDPVGPSWTTTTQNANEPSARVGHSAVTTGTVAIIWGGVTYAGSTNTGGRYNPVNDSWLPTSTGINVATARADHQAVWTGSKMVVYGGGQPGGGRYDPALDSWETMNPTGEHVGRDFGTLVWSGTYAIAWGGFDGISNVNSGGRYNPAADLWFATAVTGNAPTARQAHAAVFAGENMYIAGGYDGTVLSDAAAYNPTLDVWTTLNPMPAGTHSAAYGYADGAMVVWGGLDALGDPLGVGARLNPYTGSWTAMSVAGAPAARSDTYHAPFAGGFFVWGGLGAGSVPLDSGAVYKLKSRFTPVGSSTYVAVESGEYHICAIDQSGDVQCWGIGANGRLGDNATNDKLAPGLIGGSGPYVQISAGGSHTCGVVSGEVYCWGQNAAYQLGDGTNISKLMPVTNSTLGVIDLSAGTNHTCAVKTPGTLWCWGFNGDGQLGMGDTITRQVPTQVGVSTAWNIVASGTTHTCALQNDGTAWCWGLNTDGQLGLGHNSAMTSPTQVGVLTSWTSIAVGNATTCAIQSDNTLWCWGRNDFSQMGDNTAVNKNVPTQIGGTSDWFQVSIGVSTTCAVKLAGSLWCWGNNNDYQFGNASAFAAKTPIQIDAATDWATVSVGSGSTCATKASGQVLCAGINFNGQRGDGTTTMDTWKTLSQVGVEGPRHGGTASATDDEIVLFGGENGVVKYQNGGRWVAK